jgi:hypothetical protein
MQIRHKIRISLKILEASPGFGAPPHLVIDAPIAEEVFTSLGIDDRKIVVMYGEYMDPSDKPFDKNIRIIVKEFEIRPSW